MFWLENSANKDDIDSGFKAMAEGGHVTDSVATRSHVTDHMTDHVTDTVSRSHVTDHVTNHMTSGDHVIDHVTSDHSMVEYDHVTCNRRHVTTDYSMRQPGHVTNFVATKVQVDDGGWIPRIYQDFVDIFSKKKTETLPPH